MADKIATFKFDLVPDMELLEKRLQEARRRVSDAMDRPAAGGRARTGGTNRPPAGHTTTTEQITGRRPGGAGRPGDQPGGTKQGILAQFGAMMPRMLGAGALIGGGLQMGRQVVAEFRERSQRVERIGNQLTGEAQQRDQARFGMRNRAAGRQMAEAAATREFGGVFTRSGRSIREGVFGEGAAARAELEAYGARSAANQLQDEMIDTQFGRTGAVGTRTGGPLQATGAAGRIRGRELLQAQSAAMAAEIRADVAEQRNQSRNENHIS